MQNIGAPEGALPLICECGSADYFDRIYVTVDEYEAARSHRAHFVLESGHQDEDEGGVEEFDRYVVIEKTGPGVEWSSNPRGSPHLFIESGVPPGPCLRSGPIHGRHVSPKTTSGGRGRHRKRRCPPRSTTAAGNRSRAAKRWGRTSYRCGVSCSDKGANPEPCSAPRWRLLGRKKEEEARRGPIGLLKRLPRRSSFTSLR